MSEKIKIYKEKQKNRLVVINGENDNSTGRTDFREKMLLNNNIKGLLSLSISIVDHEKIYEYDTEGLVTLESICSKESISALKIREILQGITETVLKGSEYMLDDMDYILNPEYLYITPEGNPILAYYPGYEQPFGNQIGNLAEYLMNRIDYHEQEAVLTTYTVYMKSREEGFGVRELQSFLGNVPKKKEHAEKKIFIQRNSEFIDSDHKEFKDGKKTERQFLEVSSDYISEKEEESLKKSRFSLKKGSRTDILISAAFTVVIIAAAYKFKLLNGKDGKLDIIKSTAVLFAGVGISYYISRMLSEKFHLFGDKKCEKPFKEFEADEATELLSDIIIEKDKKSCVLVSDTYPEIKVDKFPFSIGKDEAHMDFCLKAPGISRYHIKIDMKDGEVIVNDCNSTNGTFINDEKLIPNKPRIISQGDEIRMGRCIYHVR